MTERSEKHSELGHINYTAELSSLCVLYTFFVVAVVKSNHHNLNLHS